MLEILCSLPLATRVPSQLNFLTQRWVILLVLLLENFNTQLGTGDQISIENFSARASFVGSKRTEPSSNIMVGTVIFPPFNLMM